MAETIVTLLLHKVASLAHGKILKATTVKAEMDKLEANLNKIQPILRDAYNMQFPSNEIKDWVARLNEVVYDAFDVIDYCRIQSRHLPNPGESYLSKVRRLLSSISKFSKEHLLSETGTKIMNINKRIENIYNEKDAYKLQPILDDSSCLGRHSEVKNEDRQKISGITETIIGREKDEEVINWLLEDQSNAHVETASVIAIVGMGGVGKTALAKNIYNNNSVKEFFDEFIWVCVPDMTDLLGLSKKILQEIEKTADISNFTNDNTVFCKVSSHLKNKKFLLVLDDVWNYGWWKELRLRGLCQDSGSGSKVLITTRKMEAVNDMRCAHLHELKCLDEEQSWQLFVNEVLGKGKSEEDLDGFKDVGRGIVRKCGGLPLALRTVGDLLQNKSKSDWQSVLSSPLWNWKGPQNNNEAFSAIALSYMSLSSQSQQCLTYCCLFPKDFKMKEKT